MNHREAMNQVKASCEKYKAEKGTYPNSLQVDKETWQALTKHDTVQTVIIPLLSLIEQPLSTTNLNHQIVISQK